ncbi:MAG: carcinine hydrolase/isopenicillin-N N-acyltransferase family protein [Spirochaetota bacterium]
MRMCDTLAVSGKHSRSGKMIFAKNSDRDPNEPQIMTFLEEGEASGIIHTRFCDIEGYRRDYRCFLSRPVWLWGGEMGTNSAGVSIGNEAVFTKMPYRKTGLSGMDMLRVALERCGSAKDACMMIISLLEKYHQGGNCSYDGKLLYHNSFLIADGVELYILETADDMWAYKKCDDSAAISNCLSIGKNYDAVSPMLSSRAVDFASLYSDVLITHFTCSAHRKKRAEAIIAGEGTHSKETVIALLSDRCTRKISSMRNICMNAGGGLVNSQTTASMIVEYGEKNCIWYTNGPCPEIALFKPAWFTAENPLCMEKDPDTERSWKMNNFLFRRVMESYAENIGSIRDLREKAQDEIYNLAEQASSTDSDEFLNSIMMESCEIEEEYRSCAFDMLAEGFRSFAPLRNHYWKAQEKKLLKKETDPDIRTLYMA